MKVRVTFLLGNPQTESFKVTHEEAHADLIAGDVVDMIFDSSIPSITGNTITRSYIIEAKNVMQNPTRGLDKEVMFVCKEIGKKDLI